MRVGNWIAFALLGAGAAFAQTQPLMQSQPQGMQQSQATQPPLVVQQSQAMQASTSPGKASAPAQDRIYRCGNAYTNTITEAQAKDCKLISGSNVTVVPAPRVAQKSGVVASSSQPRVDAAEQRAKDANARQILEGELRKAQARQTDLLQEYNNGEPEKQGPEFRNNQKYLDRIAELKAAIDRNASDIAGIQRELSNRAP